MIAGPAPSLGTGTQIGPYEILGWLGGGGMGEVYRAHDSRFARDVAIKIIRPSSGADAVRLQRFEQEARAAGQLNHPNILAVHDSGVHDSTPYIVSELLEGESLRSRTNSGPLQWRTALAYARQIADGLGAAHDKGIIHRDLKPENVFVTNDGRVKILDFGIAKLAHASTSPPGGEVGETEDGTVLGTAGYMSPEQVRGEQVDDRSDLFSVGAILYEMLAGRAAFTRGSRGETMAAILKESPPQPLAPVAPPPLERIVTRCLEKTREARFQSARDLAFALDQVPATATTTAVTAPIARSPRRTLWLSAAVVALTLGLIATLWGRRRAVGPPPPPLRLSVELSPGLSLAALNTQFGDAVVLSPDATTIAFVAQAAEDKQPQIFVRRLDRLHAEPLSGTDNAVAPFFSADSQWIAFSAGLKLKKIAVTGGAAATLADAPELRGGSWSTNDTIVFSPNNAAGTRLQRVAASGGGVEPLAPLADGELIQEWPQLLPNGRGVLYTSGATPGIVNSADIVVQPFPMGPRRVVQRGGYHGRYLPSGHLVYMHDGTLFAAPFDLDRLAVTGAPVAAIEGLRSNSITGGAQFSISTNGTLMYLPGPSVGAGMPIQWIDEHANTTPLRTALSNWSSARFSPDGRRLAMDIKDAPSGIWVYEIDQDRLTPLTNDRTDTVRPVWSPDGGAIAFASAGGDKSTLNLYWQRTDGTGDAHRLTESAHVQHPGSWHPSGRFLAYEEATAATNLDVMILPLEGDDLHGWKAGTPTAFVSSPAMEGDPMFSPDGKWLAYVSGESGRPEVYVRPFPGPGAKTRVSTEGGFTPTWSRTRHELFYGFFDGRTMVTPYSVTHDAFIAEKPRLWTAARYQTRGMTRMFDLHPDGARLAVATVTQPASAVRPDKAVFIFNFFDELRRIAPSNGR